MNTFTLAIWIYNEKLDVFQYLYHAVSTDVRSRWSATHFVSCTSFFQNKKIYRWELYNGLDHLLVSSFFLFFCSFLFCDSIAFAKQLSKMAFCLCAFYIWNAYMWLWRLQYCIEYMILGLKCGDSFRSFPFSWWSVN